MDEELCNELLDDIDYHFDKVKCRKIEMMMPQLMKMVEGNRCSDGITEIRIDGTTEANCCSKDLWIHETTVLRIYDNNYGRL